MLVFRYCCCLVGLWNLVQFLRNPFNRAIDHLPSSLNKLIFCNSEFSQPLDNLPDGLVTLRFLKTCATSICSLPPHLQLFQCTKRMFRKPDCLQFLSPVNKLNIGFDLEEWSSKNKCFTVPLVPKVSPIGWKLFHKFNLYHCFDYHRYFISYE